MKFAKFIFSFIGMGILNSALAQTVPFELITVAPGGTLFGDYNFKGEFGDHAMLFCLDNNQQTVGVFGWNFQGVPQLSTLPILLKIDPQFDGQFADRVGNLFIINNTSTNMVVSCVFL